MIVQTKGTKTNIVPQISVEEKTSVSEAEHSRLSKDEVLRLDGDNRGTKITSLQGILWITQNDDIVDHVLNSGDSMIICKRGRVVIGACTDSILSVSKGAILPHDVVCSGNLIGKN